MSNPREIVDNERIQSLGMHPEEILRTKGTLTSPECVRQRGANESGFSKLKQTKTSILHTRLRLRGQVLPGSDFASEADLKLPLKTS
jgi:hypothetical protein